MENDIKVNEDYKFKISYIFNFFKDMASSSSDIEDKELNEKIKKIEEQQNSNYIANLEKDIDTHEIASKKKANSRKTAKTIETEKENVEKSKVDSKEIKVDEKTLDKERTR